MKCRGVSPRTFAQLLCEISDFHFSPRKFVFRARGSKKIRNDQELVQSDPISCPQNQKGNN